MSEYLKLLVLRRPSDLNDAIGVFPHSVLEFGQDYSIIGQMVDLSAYRAGGRDDIPEKPHIRTYSLPPALWVSVYTDKGVERVRDNPYGEELVWSYAKDLKKLNIPSDADPVNKAIKAYVEQLPDDVPIILWRH